MGSCLNRRLFYAIQRCGSRNFELETLKVSFVNFRHVWQNGLAYQDACQHGKPLGSVTGESTRRVGMDGIKVFKSAQEETMSVTEEIVRVEKEVDERVKSLYGL